MREFDFGSPIYPVAPRLSGSLSYIRHNSAIGFLSALLFEESITEIAYAISSKKAPKLSKVF